MKVLRARSAGFCLGVSLALRRLDQELVSFAARKSGRLLAEKNCDNGRTILPLQLSETSRLITLGPIIHNPLVMRSYTEQGVVCESDPDGIMPGDSVVIRAHGIPQKLEQRLKTLGANLIDATCPKVKKAQVAIGKQYAKGGVLLLFGEKEHPEVRGLLSYAGDKALVFGDMRELEQLALDRDAPYFLAAQTTQERSIFMQARNYLENRLERKMLTLDTICNATRSRQQEVLELAAKVDAMVVVGGFNSGNTRRLAEVARSHNVPTIHVEQVSDMTDKLVQALLGVNTVGLTAGASTPEEHINAMQSFLEDLPA